MSVLPVLLLISLSLVALALGVFYWSLRSGQLDDLETPAHRVLWDEVETPSRTPSADQAEEP